MRTLFTIFIVTFLTGKTFGQYPFEKFPAIKYKEIKDWKIYDKSEKEKKVHYTVTIPGFYKNYDTVTIQITELTDNDSVSFIRVYRNKNQVQKIIEPFGIGGGVSYLIAPEPQAIYSEDINGDSLEDLKIIIPGNGCCGAYNFYLQVIYLFQRTDGTFTQISFSDLMMDYTLRPERDFDGDGNYEIITQTFQNFNGHNYWLFNLYNFKGDSLINVNYKDNYPIMTQLLYRDNFEITDKITKEKMKTLEKKLPDDYDKR